MSTRTPAKGRSPQPKRPGPKAVARQQRQRRLVLRGALLAAVALAALFVLSRIGGDGGGTASGGGPAFIAGQPGPGEQAPAIELASTDGTMFDLAEQRGKTVLLYFHEGLGCQPCWDQIKEIEQDFAPFEALGVDIFVPIAGNPLGDLRRKVADDDLATPVLADPSLSLGETYRANQYGMMGTSSYGHSFIVVGPDGEIRWRADYGGAPDFTMYVRPAALLADLRDGLSGPTGS